MALRYASEIVLSAPGGSLAQRIGPRRMLILLSFATAASMLLLGTSGLVLWAAVIFTVVLRALLQPLPGPVVALAFPGPDRVQALARQATWRDIGAGAGPLAAGLLFPALPAVAVFALSGGLLAASTALLVRERTPGAHSTGT
jgi:predicted MFS family arabinose efflux permease